MIIDIPGDAYKIINYPAGEIQVRLRDADVFAEVAKAESIVLNARVTDSEEILTLLLLVNAIKGVNAAARLILHIPYLPYGRADRRFVNGDCSGLFALGQILNICQFATVRTLDAHNHEAAGMSISKFVDLSPAPLIAKAVVDFAARHKTDRLTILLSTVGLYVTHGIFSKGFGDLLCAFGHIYTTDSITDWRSHDLLTVYETMEGA